MTEGDTDALAASDGHDASIARVAVDVRPLDATTFEAFVALHAHPECAGCYCSYWHFEGDNRAWQMAVPADNLARKRDRVARGADHGLLAFAGGRAVASMQLHPRDDLTKLLRRMPYAGLAAEPNVWAVACFMVLPEHRRRGTARVLLRAAVTYARGVLNAVALEAFPRRGEDLGAAEVWTGPEALFVSEGFVVARDHVQYPILRRALL